MGPTLERRGRCAAGDPTNQVGWKFADPTVAGLTELADDRWRRAERKTLVGGLGRRPAPGRRASSPGQFVPMKGLRQAAVAGPTETSGGTLSCEFDARITVIRRDQMAMSW